MAGRVGRPKGGLDGCRGLAGLAEGWIEFLCRSDWNSANHQLVGRGKTSLARTGRIRADKKAKYQSRSLVSESRLDCNAVFLVLSANFSSGPAEYFITERPVQRREDKERRSREGGGAGFKEARQSIPRGQDGQVERKSST